MKCTSCHTSYDHTELDDEGRCLMCRTTLNRKRAEAHAAWRRSIEERNVFPLDF